MKSEKNEIEKNNGKNSFLKYSIYLNDGDPPTRKTPGIRSGALFRGKSRTIVDIAVASLTEKAPPFGRAPFGKSLVPAPPISGRVSEVLNEDEVVESLSKIDSREQGDVFRFLNHVLEQTKSHRKLLR